jgi:hypothetical protein
MPFGSAQSEATGIKLCRIMPDIGVTSASLRLLPHPLSAIERDSWTLAVLEKSLPPPYQLALLVRSFRLLCGHQETSFSYLHGPHIRQLLKYVPWMPLSRRGTANRALRSDGKIFCITDGGMSAATHWCSEIEIGHLRSFPAPHKASPILNSNYNCYVIYLRCYILTFSAFNV